MINSHNNIKPDPPLLNPTKKSPDLPTRPGQHEKNRIIILLLKLSSECQAIRGGGVMKRLLVMVILLGMTAVYRPGSIVPVFYIQKGPQSEYRI